jgi:hypothetical protein
MHRIFGKQIAFHTGGSVIARVCRVYKRLSGEPRIDRESRAKKGLHVAGKNIAVFGICRGMSNVESILDELKVSGFRNEDISILFPENLGPKELTTVKSTKGSEGAAIGGTSGAVLGGALGWLTGIGALAIPGVGPLIAAGPIVAALAGVGAGGAIGGIAGGLAGLGLPEYEAKRYEGHVLKGGILLSVHCDKSDWEKLAKRILEAGGAQDIASRSEGSADFGKDEPMPKTGTHGD